MSSSYIGKYKIAGEAARTGTGIAYNGTDLDGRPVTLRILDSSIVQDPAFVERLLKEAGQATAVTGQNVLRVYDIFKHEDTYCIALERAGGESLAQIIERSGPLPFDKVKSYGLQIAKALEEMHTRNIILGDINSSDVIVSNTGEAKLMCFGITRLIASAGEEDSGLMREKAFMSPERFLGSQIDNRSDIYSFGVILFHMLTGHLPVESDGESSAAQKSTYKESTPPSKFNPAVPQAVDIIVQKAMAHFKTFRYQRISEITLDLKLKFPAESLIKQQADAQELTPPQGPQVSEVPRITRRPGDEARTKAPAREPLKPLESAGKEPEVWKFEPTPQAPPETRTPQRPPQQTPPPQEREKPRRRAAADPLKVRVSISELSEAAEKRQKTVRQAVIASAIVILVLAAALLVPRLIGSRSTGPSGTTTHLPSPETASPSATTGEPETPETPEESPPATPGAGSAVTLTLKVPYDDIEIYVDDTRIRITPVKAAQGFRYRIDSLGTGTHEVRLKKGADTFFKRVQLEERESKILVIPAFAKSTGTESPPVTVEPTTPTAEPLPATPEPTTVETTVKTTKPTTVETTVKTSKPTTVETTVKTTKPTSVRTTSARPTTTRRTTSVRTTRATTVRRTTFRTTSVRPATRRTTSVRPTTRRTTVIQSTTVRPVVRPTEEPIP